MSCMLQYYINYYKILIFFILYLIYVYILYVKNSFFFEKIIYLIILTSCMLYCVLNVILYVMIK
ncbi:ORF MSV249 hypotehtical protein [Melanoplus sanguinipes entomopoxvirus]|uniref:ORF MSV249 hypotehtical protein n=1 Tax=Melanoplus sanguinipes entomopoxvirus TaxID=83191 RepID=Q9YVJ3_MSEPV|nr:ORF MSV249 hypotehtical protein [Melanoplus sanguinipes entomopoxvirus]AAC97725.1 ORF MSV249 hypotehtical protein [Melanoplus sanguinipes entomopoxvirus 'O']